MICSQTYLYFSDDIENEGLEEGEKFDQKNVKSEGFTCDLCDYSSKNPKLLIAHVKNTHKSSKTLSKFKCTYCNLEFQTDKVLQKHQATVHSQLVAASGFKHCGQCNASFGTMELLDEHLKTVHGVQKQSIMREMIRYQSGKPAMCPICGVGFTG